MTTETPAGRELPEPALNWPTGAWLRNGSRVHPGDYYTADQMTVHGDARYHQGREDERRRVVTDAMVTAALDVRPFTDAGVGHRVWQMLGYSNEYARRIMRAALVAALETT